MSKKVCIVLIGGPCSGKSSAGKLVAKKLDAEYVSSGDIAREMAERSDIVKDNLNNGQLAPEQQMRDAVFSKLWQYFESDNRDIVILDGFPRFGEQAEWLRNVLPVRIEIRYVIIHAPSWVLRSRANARGRSDDGSFERRLDYYRKVTYKDLYSYAEAVIHTQDISIDECAMLLTDFVKEVMKC